MPAECFSRLGENLISKAVGNSANGENALLKSLALSNPQLVKET